MATLASLVKAVGRDTRTLPEWPTFTTLVGASNRALQIAAWVDEAWTNIQNEEQDWLWMRAEFTSALVIDQLRYTPTNLGVNARFGSWVWDTPYMRPVSIYDSTIGLSDEHALQQIEYDQWYETYGRNTHTHNRPIEWTISPANELCVGPKPDKAYVFRGVYQKSPQSLTVDADTPEMPTRFHNLVKWEAIRLLQIADGANLERQIGQAEYVNLRSQLAREQLPTIMIASNPVGI